SVIQVTATIEGTLEDILAGRVQATVGSGVLSWIAEALVNGLGSTVGTILNNAIFGSSGLVPTLGTTLDTATEPVITILGTVFTDILGANGLVSLRVNVQNDPAAGDEHDPPLIYPEWEPAGSRPVAADQYDVAALSISLLDLAGAAGNINLELARSSVGVSCAVGGVWDN